MSQVLVLDRLTKKHLILYIFKIFAENNVILNYRKAHIVFKNIQEELVKEHNLTFGYLFEDGGVKAINKIYDHKFQKDIERYVAFEDILKNENIQYLPEVEGYVTHKIMVNELGEYILKSNATLNLIEKIGNLKGLSELIMKAHNR